VVGSGPLGSVQPPMLIKDRSVIARRSIRPSDTPSRARGNVCDPADALAQKFAIPVVNSNERG